MRQITSRDKAVAYKAILLSGVSGSAMSVCGALIDHYNRRTGQCDPSISRIAQMLGLSRATVFRSLGEIVVAKMFHRASHGSRMGRNAYAPNWAKFQAIVTDWDARMLANAAARKVSEVRPDRSQFCDVDGLSSETQTHLINPFKETQESGTTGKAERKPPPPDPREGQSGQAEEAGTRAQQFLIHAVPGGKPTPSYDEVARGKAWERIERGLLQSLGQDGYEKAVAVVDQAMIEGATTAELQRPGTGLANLMRPLQSKVRQRNPNARWGW